MDKEWMRLPSRLVPEYEEGVQKFLGQARKYAKTREVILCPCKRCKNKKYMKFDQVYEHLIIKGFDPSYTIWVFHGENYTSQFQGEGSSGGVQEEEDESREAYHLYRDVFVPEEELGHTMPETRDYEFGDLLEDAETPLFPGCTTYTKLSAVVTLYNYKSTNGHTDSSFNELLEILGGMLPEKNTLPKTVYSVRNLLKPFDLGYEKIHACPNDCCLFRKELKDLDSCPKCGSSRWKVDKVTTKVCRGVPEKVLRYFPVIPRLKRMFKSEEKAEDLIWHSNHKSQDHMMRHPVDSVAWDTINQKWPAFASDPRNLRLGLATDGFNPFGDLSSRYSCWPVILVNYNLPPLMCMAKENLMLTLLIPGPKQPGNDIDVYLEPLVEDLKELWDTGVDAYDAFSKSVFNMKAILMWTINDFPAYGNLAGCATKGKVGCPICGEDICSMWLKYSRKFAYLGHRRFLAPDHTFRQKKKWFNGKKERKGKPRPLTGLEILNAVNNIENDWGKKKNGETINTTKKKRKKNDSSKKVQNPVQMWKKKSIFFDLPYWSGLLLRHNLDVMHVEKNVCENIIGTLLNVKKKSKDGINARKDLMHLKIREELHPQEKGENMYHLPAAPYTLSKKEMDVFCSRLKKIKLPDGYSSNIGKCVSLEEHKLIGLKSHDCHVLMQQLLSVALRSLLPKGPRNALFLLCAFYNELCQRVLDRNRLEQLEENIAETLCMLERYFPPAFFTISVHLTIHLAREARLCGPVQFRWMYPFERFMKVLKGYVKNRARPEGCIAECYLAEERMRFCSAYIKKAATIGVRSNRNEDLENGLVEGRPISQGKEKILEDHVLQAAHRYVLFNTAEVEPYLQSLYSIQKMSKTGKKRSKASVDEIQEKIANSLSRMDSNTSPNSSQDLHGKEPIDDGKTDKKKGRGASKLNLVSGQQKPKELERNEFGQPIGDNSVKYATFLGCMVKEFVPYTLDGWNDIDEEVKNRMWSCLQLNYNVEEWEKKSVFQKLGKLWRDRKSKLQILIREVNAGRVASRDFSLLKPEFMDQNQWDLFVKRTLSPAFQEKSAKFRAIREKQDHIHTMSRRGYARLACMMEKTSTTDTPITRSKVWIEGHKKKNGQPCSQAAGEKMKELEECLPESQNTTNISDDAISLVFGKEARGRVRGMGFGVTPSKVGASVQQNGTIKQLQSTVLNLQQEMQEIKSMFFQNMRQRNEQEQVASGDIGSSIGNDVGGGSDMDRAKKSGNVDNVNQHLAAAQSKLKNVTRGDILVNSKCKLLHWCVDGVVAEGRIASTDPNAKVHHVLLGGSCWKVWVDRVFVEKVDLIRPNDEMLFLEDAIGSTVAWLSKFIDLCD